ncbi:methyltransferase [Sphaerisporangium siamense]|uniref:SAM-dependent methyltransferase n=1 Tax=Sphaerisporangium siamense TaxID=795645 RepID=A0A7W7G749_9ACTN|nr:class I SAM-dependent methyltransferase [Sphaerisporangium siamense]MBB4698752.1 SAM-dependent methyltransferase [Sphaerisporangium siamense]GII85187.1 methyltransferase [Sphaerisporangium siamense]
MLNYDAEASTYDRTRGGDARAASAAAAITRLLPSRATLVADLACGTGIVTARVAAPRVVGIDLSHGMARLAAARLPGRIALGDVTAVPLADGSVDAVVMIWLLHLLDHTASARALSEAARVLRPGGTLLTTVDKDAAYYVTPSDVADLIAPVRARHVPPPSDAHDRVTDLATALGLSPAGRTTFPGDGQGHSPRGWAELILTRRLPWTKRADPGTLTALTTGLHTLPDQDRPRPDPVYPLVSFTKG